MHVGTPQKVQAADVIRVYEETGCTQQTATRLGVSRQRVSQILRRRNIEPAEAKKQVEHERRTLRRALRQALRRLERTERRSVQRQQRYTQLTALPHNTTITRGELLRRLGGYVALRQHWTGNRRQRGPRPGAYTNALRRVARLCCLHVITARNTTLYDFRKDVPDATGESAHRVQHQAGVHQHHGD
jgi:transcriptional regulator with XRE-family HTH domain